MIRRPLTTDIVAQLIADQIWHRRKHFVRRAFRARIASRGPDGPGDTIEQCGFELVEGDVSIPVPADEVAEVLAMVEHLIRVDWPGVDLGVCRASSPSLGAVMGDTATIVYHVETWE